MVCNVIDAIAFVVTAVCHVWHEFLTPLPFSYMHRHEFFLTMMSVHFDHLFGLKLGVC